MATATAPGLVHRLNVYQTADGEQSVQAVFQAQDCGKIEGGGTCISPLRIKLAPPYSCAPELLEACKGLLTMLEEWNAGFDEHDAVEEARAAIAKAGGE